MDRSTKEELVAEMRERLSAASSVIIARQSGLTVAEVFELRRQMRAANVEFKVIKNTLAKITVKGTPLEGIEKFFCGPTAVAFSKDPVAPAKIIDSFANKNEKITIIGGYLNGKVLEEKDAKALAKLPSLGELRAKLIALISSPATKIAVLMKEPAIRIARVLVARGQNA